MGPVIGALFSKWAQAQTGVWFVWPALFALSLVVADILFVTVCFKETLPKVRLVFLGNFYYMLCFWYTILKQFIYYMCMQFCRTSELSQLQAVCLKLHHTFTYLIYSVFLL